ncbi:hypothetical protein F7018_13130 [Tenacibaculum aiptasiae]|uniref:BZIP transcription factor n=1 Tax=Tenacibaculum aiptasiae TaxID=426481 RepID=A0A7J5AD13_9FLAO|nr:hypothetical protein [Tenacibaculum aiptasiae]KAB1155410.1 hypothetical protein F7018_13130 [Tenacibaculum aiptasiae]
MKKTIFLLGALLLASFNLKAQGSTHIIYFDKDGSHQGSEGLFINGGVGGGTITTFRSFTTGNISEVNFKANRELRAKGRFYADGDAFFARAANFNSGLSASGNSTFSRIGIGVTPQQAIHVKNQNVRVDNGEYQSWGALIFHPDVDNTGDDIISFRNSANGEMAKIHDGVLTTNRGVFNNSISATEGNLGSVSYTQSTGRLSLGHGINGKITFLNGSNNEMAFLQNGVLTLDRVVLNVGSFPDYVFSKNYELMPLKEVAAYIQENKHLPNMPSEAEVIAKGMDIKQINTVLVEKVEELTLHTISQEEKIDTLLNELKVVEKKSKETEKKMQALLERLSKIEQQYNSTKN